MTRIRFFGCWFPVHIILVDVKKFSSLTIVLSVFASTAFAEGGVKALGFIMTLLTVVGVAALFSLGFAIAAFFTNGKTWKVLAYSLTGLLLVFGVFFGWAAEYAVTTLPFVGLAAVNFLLVYNARGKREVQPQQG